MDGLERVMAGRLRSLLDEHEMRHEDLARGMTDLGFRWTANRVTQVVTSRRPLSLLEAAGVCCLLRMPLADLLGSDGEVELPGGSVEVNTVRRALLGEVDGGWRELGILSFAGPLTDSTATQVARTAAAQDSAGLSDSVTIAVTGTGAATASVTAAGTGEPVWSEATLKAARRLGAQPAQVARAAQALWGRNLSDERDRRVQPGPDEAPRALQARRGHVTRTLVNELRQHLSGEQS